MVENPKEPWMQSVYKTALSLLYVNISKMYVDVFWIN